MPDSGNTQQGERSHRLEIRSNRQGSTTYIQRSCDFVSRKPVQQGLDWVKQGTSECDSRGFDHSDQVLLMCRAQPPTNNCSWEGRVVDSIRYAGSTSSTMPADQVDLCRPPTLVFKAPPVRTSNLESWLPGANLSWNLFACLFAHSLSGSPLRSFAAIR
jgi:hypothetical protein